MDPLSIAASITSVVTIADIVFLRLVKYAKSAKDAKSEVQALSRETNLLAGTLHSLSSLAAGLVDEPFDAALRMHHISTCHETLSKLNRNLDKAEADFGKPSKVDILQRKLKWPFSATRTKELLSEISRHKESMILALSADSMNMLLYRLSRHDELQTSTAEILDTVKKTHDITVRIQDDSGRRKTLGFFMKSNPHPRYEMSLSLRHPRTGLWLDRVPEYQTWLSTPGSKLWLSGIPGAGKTVLAGSILETILGRSTESIGVAFFFCDYKDGDTHQPLHILGALAAQLAMQKDEAFDVLQQYYKELHPSKSLPKNPTVHGLEGVLQDMVQLFEQVFMVIDGLDECGNLTEEAADTLATVAAETRNISIALISRSEHSIRDLLEEDYTEIEIAAHTEDLTEYVAAQIEERIRSRRLRIRDPGLKGEILQCLVDGAMGMFRWAACQLDHICELSTDKARREALDKLPPDLNETYIRILQRIPKSRKALVQMTLQFIVHAEPKLTIKQLCEVLSVPEDGRSMDTRDLIHADDISRACSSLVRLSKDGRYFELAHFTVQEFLGAESLVDSGLQSYQISELECNRLLAVQCLRFLQLDCFGSSLDEGDTKDIARRNERHPLYEYAVLNWTVYTRGNWHDDTLLSLAKGLFNPKKTAAFMAWASELARLFCDLIKLEEHEPNLTSKPKAAAHQNYYDEISPLHLAATLALTPICKYLIDGGAKVDLKSPFGTPLHCAIGSIFTFSKKVNRDFLDFEDPYLVDMKSSKDMKDTVDYLLEVGANTSVTCPTTFQGLSLISMAFLVGKDIIDFDVVMTLLSAGVCLDERDLVVFSQVMAYWRIHAYMHTELKSTLSSLLQFLSPMVSASTALFDLCSLAWKEAIWWDVPLTADPTMVDSRISLSEEALIHGAISAVGNRNEETLRKLLADPRLQISEVVDEYGCPLLHVAVGYAENTAVVKMLLEAGCLVSEPNLGGELPIHLWFVLKDEDGEDDDIVSDEVLSLLVEHGATIDAQDLKGQNALHWHVNFPGRLAKLLRVSDVETNAKALCTRDNDGYTPLSKALEGGYEESASILLEHSKQNLLAWQSPTPVLVLAAQMGFTSIIQQLVKAGVDLNDGAGDFSTPLHHLRASGSLECVRLLKSLYKDGCDLRFHGRLPVELFLFECLTTDDTALMADADAAIHVFEELVCSQSLETTDPKGKLLWEDVALSILAASTHSSVTGFRKQMAASAISCLLRVGAMKAYETASKECGLLPLLAPYDPRAAAIHPIWPESAADLCQVIDQSQHWSKTKDCPTVSGLLKSAILSDELPVVEVLLDKGVSIHQRIDDLSPIEEACTTTSIDKEMFQTLLAHSDPGRLDEINRDGLGLIHRLPESDSAWRVEELVRRGANPNLRVNMYHRSPALVHHLMSSSFEVAGALLQNGADSTYDANDGIDAALSAASRGASTILNKIHILDACRRQQNWQKTCSIAAYIAGKTPSFYRLNALHLASLGGHIDCLEFYIGHNFLTDVNEKSDGGYTPMHFAAMGGHSDMIRHLHAKGGQVDAISDNRSLPLHFAVRNNRLGVVETLLELGSKHMPDSRNTTPLMYACQMGYQSIIDYLRKKFGKAFNTGQDGVQDSADMADGASTRPEYIKALSTLVGRRNYGSSIDQPILHEAASRGDFGAVKLLLESGAEVDSFAPGQGTALHVVARTNKRDAILIAELLLHHGASTESWSNPGFTVLMEAAKRQNIGLIDTLLKTKPSLNVKTSKNYNLLHFIANWNMNNGEPSCELVQMFARLLGLGLDIHAVNDVGVTPIHLAMRYGAYTGLLLNGDFKIEDTPPFPWSVLLSRDNPFLTHKFKLFRRRIPGAKFLRILNLRPLNYWSPLCVFASVGKFEEIKALISLGAELEYEGSSVGTALMTASAAGQLQVVKFLVRIGAAISYWGNDGFRSAIVAGKHSKRIVRWLICDRFADQMRLSDTCSSSTIDKHVKYWSGVLRAELHLPRIIKGPRAESLKDYHARRLQVRRDPNTPLQSQLTLA